MPTTVENVFALLDAFAPCATAEEWDNVGLLVHAGSEVTGILCALDVTPETLAEAESLGCNLLVTHHPVIFHPLQSISANDLAAQLLQKGISAICMHTNLDKAPRGVNDALAGVLGVQVTDILDGMGRVGDIVPLNVLQLAQRCEERLHTQVKYVDNGRTVHRVALLGGSGGDAIAAAKAAGADCLVTGEASYHDAQLAAQLGIGLIAAGHYATEFPVVHVLATLLHEAFPQARVIEALCGKDSFSYL